MESNCNRREECYFAILHTLGDIAAGSRFEIERQNRRQGQVSTDRTIVFVRGQNGDRRVRIARVKLAAGYVMVMPLANDTNVAVCGIGEMFVRMPPPNDHRLHDQRRGKEDW